jgi:succinate dehydrogenase / fumarate reductase cytochrome b subunit
VATTASPASPISAPKGVAPLGTGHGHSFLLRRLHSLSGIIPVGAFLIEHFVSNAFATRGPGAYTKQVELLSSFPFVFYLEFLGILLTII